VQRLVQAIAVIAVIGQRLEAVGHWPLALGLVDFDQQGRFLARQRIGRAFQDFELEALDIHLDETDIGKIVVIEPALLDRPGTELPAVELPGLQRAALVGKAPGAVDRQQHLGHAVLVRQRDLMHRHVGRHAAAQQRADLRVGLERLDRAADPAEQVAVDALVGADIDGDGARFRQQGDGVQFAFAAPQPPADKVAQIKRSRDQRMLDAFLE